MTDLLVRLYDLPQSEAGARVARAGIVIRRALPPERDTVIGWVAQHFTGGWAAEAAMALGQLPVRCWIATQASQLVGFACFDATAKGLFGPTGVAEAARGAGIGEALLFATLGSMREAGYAYAVIGDPGPTGFYTDRLDAMPIPNSEPGLYRGMLR